MLRHQDAAHSQQLENGQPWLPGSPLESHPPVFCLPCLLKLWQGPQSRVVTGWELGFLQPLQGLVGLAGLRRSRRWKGVDVSSEACVLEVVFSVLRGGGTLAVVGVSGHACLMSWPSSHGTLVLHRRLLRKEDKPLPTLRLPFLLCELWCHQSGGDNPELVSCCLDFQPLDL